MDSDNADKLSAFYERLLGWTRFNGEEFTTLANVEQGGFPTWITFQQVDDYVPPVWLARDARPCGASVLPIAATTLDAKSLRPQKQISLSVEIVKKRTDFTDGTIE